jgi:periplasmic divalent cation tolerance protein
MPDKYIMIMVMCASGREAVKIADRLLAKRIIACANMIDGAVSKFRWKGRIDKANETLLMMKTRMSNFKKAASEVKRLHSYEVPEIIAIPIVALSKDYLEWIKESTDA